MADHLADSQPRHHDAGMDALIRRLEQGPGGEQAQAETAPTPGTHEEQGTLAERPDNQYVEAETPETEETIEAEAEEVVQEQDLDDPLVPVRINGVEEQVPLSELMQGYSRNADYTRKTQALAQERRAIESERAQLMLASREAVERAASLANQLEQELAMSRPDPQRLAELRATNPAEYAAVIADEQRREAMVAQARQEAAMVQQREVAQRVEREKNLLMEREPAFANDFDGTYAALGRWVTDPAGGGVRVEDWNRETDHNRILIAYRAWRAAEQAAVAGERNSSVQRKVAKLPRVRSGARIEPGETERQAASAAMDRMRETGRTKDIAAALMARRDASRASRRRGPD